ncbi:hypothetical protein DFH08DRAFT_899829 [Mycena albidolilacea]|uniref:Uncharacterized protein n=1 Tax=Mycena albidolilacea TaxID=1033008 RepID=A0AAD7EBW7_9AGAR|nr:hypothetical protein DFH08DRAFT_899829 [Mycena albidolilacea]
MSSSDLGKSSHGIPDVVMVQIDKYVDSLAPQIQQRIASELDVFQQRTIDSLEDQVVAAFRSLFSKDTPAGGSPGHVSRSLDASAPEAYGVESLPFADEIASLTRSFSKIADGAGDDLRDIFDLTDGGPVQQTRGADDLGGHTRSFTSSGGGGPRGFLSAAIGAVQDHLDKGSHGGHGPKVQLDGLLGVLSQTVKDVARHPEEKARAVVPEIREKVAARLRDQHAPIAEQFTRIALDKIKRWLRGNTSTRDIGEGVSSEVKDEIKGLVKGMKGLFGHQHNDDGAQARGLDSSATSRVEGGEGGGGFSKLLSDKLSTGLARVHREVRLEFRTMLGGIEKQLFELLPDEVQGPLERILGGNPFDAELDRNTALQGASRGFGDDIKFKLVEKIRQLVRKVQETLRESILSVVNGGHRKFERESWVFVQSAVELKVQKYLPHVRITVPDDIGNEGVSVGAVQGAQMGGGQAPGVDHARPDQPYQSYNQNPSYEQPQSHGQQQSYGQHPTYDKEQGYGQQQSYGQPPTYR